MIKMMLVRPVSVWKQPCRVIALLLFVSLLFFSPVGAFAQGRGLVQGTVVDSAGEPLVGATVVPGRSSKGAVVTDMEGHFTLNTSLFSVPCDIHINYVGFQEYKIHLTTKQSRNLGIITLADDNHMLNDVVVIGYGQETRKNLTGAISTVKGELVKEATQDAPVLALQGKATGVLVTQASGMPGGGNTTITIRGDASLLNLPTPLYIIDGVPFNSNASSAVGYTSTGVFSLPDELAFLNPDDIQSMEILKDADATAIYGTRGANGVVLITTKRGKEGRVNVNLQVSGTASWISKRLDFLDTQSYLDIRKKAFQVDLANGDVKEADFNENNYPDLLLWDQNKDYDWQELLLGNTAWGTDTKLSISGGNKNTAFYISGGWYKTGSPTIGDEKYTRWNGRANLQHHSSDNRLNLEAGFSISRLNMNADAASSGYSYLNTAPNTPPFNEDGTVYWIPGDTSYEAPLAFLNYSGENEATSTVMNLAGSYRVWNNLTAKISVGYEHSSSNQQNLYERNYFNPYDETNYNQALYFNVTTQTLNVEPQLNYAANILGGDASFMVGATYQTNDSKNIYMRGQRYPSDMFLRDANSAAILQYHQNPKYQSKTASVFGRINYNYGSRYIANLVYRRDGSSRFGPNHRWGDFWSVGAGWLFGNEEFVKQSMSSWLSHGKLRFSYGKTGSDRGISDYSYMTKYTTTSYPYEGEIGVIPGNLANNDLHWETTYKFDVGLEVGLFKDRMLVGVNYYNNQSKDLLSYYTLPRMTGFTRILKNQDMLIENSGVELELNATPVRTKNFEWSTNLNFTFPKNVLKRYPGLESSSYANTYEIGKSINIFRGYKYLGVNAQNGIPEVEDLNQDGRITQSGDYQTLGNIDPTFYGGWNNTFKFKGFTLDLSIYFRKQEYKRGYLWLFYSPAGMRSNITRDMAENHWTTPGQPAKYPGLTTTSRSDLYYAYYYYLSYSDYSYSDGSYIRLSNVKFSYDFPKNWIKPLGMQSLQLYVQGRNLLTLTNYDAYDPETGTGSVPATQQFTFGANITF